MNLQDFLLLQALYENKNISKTADALYLAQPTVSKRLRLMEEEFGITIAQRGKHGVSFTPEGEYLAVKAAQINGMMAQVRQHLNEMSREPVKKLTIGASNASIHTDLLDYFQEFRTLHPKIELELINKKSSQLVRLLEQEQLDFAFVSGDVAFSGSKISFQQDRPCIGSLISPEPGQPPALPYLDYPIDPATKGILEKWWSQQYTLPFPTGLRVTGAEVARDLVLKGLGFAFFSRKDYLDGHPELIHPLSFQDGTPVIRRNWCIYHEARLLGRPEAELFLSYLKSRL